MASIDGVNGDRSLIRVRGLDKKYIRGSEEIHVLQGLNLDVDAGAFVADPTFLLCDEPTGDLDRKSADEILDLVHTLARQHNKTVLMVTHDPLAADRADTVFHMDKGALVHAENAGVTR